MFGRLSFVVVLALAILPLSAGTCGAEELKKMSLDDTAALGLRIESDSQVKVEGKSSIKITTLWPTTICLGEVAGLNVKEATLYCRARVKTEIEGHVVLEMWAHVDGAQYFSRYFDAIVANKSDWTRVSTPFAFQKGQKPDKVTLILIIYGTGTVWIDDLTLSKEDP